MDSIEKKLRDKLHLLIFGERSPNYFLGSDTDIKKLQDSGHIISEIHKVELNIKDNSFDDPISDAIVFDSVEGFMFPMHSLNKFSFITLEDERLDFAVNNSMIGGKNNFYFRLILEEKDISESEIYNYKDAFYGNTYKVEIRIWAILLSKKSPFEYMARYYHKFVNQEIKLIRNELEKYLEPHFIKEHCGLIELYKDKIHDIISKTISEKRIEFYQALFEGLNILYNHISKFSSNSKNEYTNIPNSFIWTGNFPDFIKFIKPVIDSGKIKFNNSSDKLPIYKILLHHFCIEANPNVTDKELCKCLKIPFDILNLDYESIKLDWIGTVAELAQFIKPELIDDHHPERRIKCGISAPKKDVAEKLSNLFLVKQNNNTGKYCKPSSLVQTLRVDYL